ncbi:pilus assembly protein [Shewanella sp. 3B26]|uniref:Pilus assembly protein n=1 Tax=Shewanella zhuhaiensis TaxID=2919576 RepID=A0AAJ1BFT5_9GAMM|nr:pilus assembly protein [Shewanella zhuhaiensis]MCH4293084.1 pilus assembly protein [Shewanella zhuhaiensis]
MKKRKIMGMAATEYVLVLALVAIAAIGVYSFFGKTLRNQVAGLASELSGQDAQQNIQNAKSAADNGETVANKDYNLGNYNEGANKAASGQ